MFGASDGHADLQEGQFHAKGAIPNDTGFVAFIGSRRVTERTSILQSLKSMFSMPLLRTSDMSLLVGEAFLFPTFPQNRWGWWHSCQESAAWHFHWREAGQGTDVISDVLVAVVFLLNVAFFTD